MRFTGACSRNVKKIREFVNRAALLGDPRRQAIISFPPDDPIVAAVIDTRVNPSVHYAQRPDGSFAMVDGEFYRQDSGREIRKEDRQNSASLILRDERLVGIPRILREGEAAAFVTVWDAQTETLCLARDRLGVVPAFYADENGVTYWGSDFRTLLAVTSCRQINLAALDFFVGNGFVPAPWTMVQGMHRIPPAHAVTRQTRQNSGLLKRYWQPRMQAQQDIDLEETARRLQPRLTKSLRCRVSDNGPTGVLLSGGVDSRLLLAGLRRLLDFPPEAVRTYTFRYEKYDGVYNETDEARLAADYFGTEHTEIAFAPEDVSDDIDSIISAFGEPFSYGLHTLKLGVVARDNIDTILSGAGPDGWYPEQLETWALRYRSLPTTVQAPFDGATRLVGWTASALDGAPYQGAARAAGGLATRLKSIQWCGRHALPSHTAGILAPTRLRRRLYVNADWADNGEVLTIDLFRNAFADLDGEAPRDRMISIHQSTYGADSIMNWNHWCARQHGLRVAFPFNDMGIHDLVSQLPRNNSSKLEFRHLAATLMPARLAYGPKVAQSIPLRHWFRSSLREFVSDELTEKRINAHGLFRFDTVNRLRNQHLRGQVNHEWKLWGVLVIHRWIDSVLNAATIAEGQARDAAE